MKVIEKTLRDVDYYVTREFGDTNIIHTPKGDSTNEHKGTDYGTHGKNSKIYCLEDGIVTRSDEDKYGTKIVIINYPRLKIDVQYNHMDKVFVKDGDKVNDETILGLVGQTGRATGIHLDLRIKKNGTTYIDPEKYNYKLEENNTNKKDEKLLLLVKRTIRGDFGNGKNRKLVLGNLYSKVQKQVNLNFKNKTIQWDNIKLY